MEVSPGPSTDEASTVPASQRGFIASSSGIHESVSGNHESLDHGSTTEVCNSRAKKQRQLKKDNTHVEDWELAFESMLKEMGKP